MRPSKLSSGACAALVAALLTVVGNASADTFQTWYQHNLWLRLDPRWSVGTYADARVTDAFGEHATTLLSPRLRYDVTPYWSLQFNTAWVDAQGVDGRGRRESLRLEAEANPRYALTETLTFSARNRFEARDIEATPGWNHRLRVRPQLDWRTPWARVVRGVFLNHEVIYDFGRDQVTEHRLIPFGLVFQPARHTELRAYHLWRHATGGAGWFDFHVFGLQANTSF